MLFVEAVEALKSKECRGFYANHELPVHIFPGSLVFFKHFCIVFFQIPHVQCHGKVGQWLYTGILI